MNADLMKSKAVAGDVEAQYELSWRLSLGQGLEQDEAEGLRWLREAAQNGHKLAQNNLGARHVAGDGVPRDLSKAYYWFSRAAEQGDRKAGKNRDSIAQEMTAEEIARAAP